MYFCTWIWCAKPFYRSVMLRVARGNLGNFNCDIVDLKRKTEITYASIAAPNALSVDC